MKILLVHNKYRSEFVGGEDVVFASELLALKQRLGQENVFEYTATNDQINKLGLLFSIWFSKKHYQNIYNLVKFNKIDLVHVHNFFPLLTLSIFKAAKDAGAKTINTLHNYRWWCLSGIFYRNQVGICELCAKKKFAFWGVFYRCYRKSIIQSLLAALAFYFYKLIKLEKYIDKFFVLTNFEKGKVKELGIPEKKIILKPNFANYVTPLPIASKQGYIYVGKLDKAKGIEKLLEIWQNLSEKYVLKIVGSGDLDKQLLKKYKKNNVIFLGKVDHQTTLEEVAKSKYLIQPSLMYETSGLTILEAIGVGVPVIGFDVGTRKDFIRDSVNGFLAKEDNLEDVIVKSFNFSNYSELSNQATKTAETFKKEKIIKEQVKIYESIIEL